MGTLIKTLAILFPTAIVAIGVFLIFQAANFWIEVMGPTNVRTLELNTASASLFVARVFAPERIRTEDPPLLVEVEIKALDNPDRETEVRVNLTPQCDYLRTTEPASALKFGSKQALVQSATPKLSVRNITPPPDCAVEVEAFYGNATTPSASTIFPITVDAWTGHLLAFVKLLIGVVGALGGLRGIIGAFGL